MWEEEVPSFSVTVISFHCATVFVFARVFVIGLVIVFVIVIVFAIVFVILSFLVFVIVFVIVFVVIFVCINYNCPYVLIERHLTKGPLVQCSNSAVQM